MKYKNIFFYETILLIIILLFLPFKISKGGTNTDVIQRFNREQTDNLGSALYDSIFQNIFPIIASHPVPAGLIPMQESFQTLKDCGFNTISYALSSNNIDRAVSIAKETGIKMILRTGSLLHPEGEDIVKKYRNTDEIIGWYLKDEPAYEELDTVKFYYDKIKELSPDKLVYINLIGDAIKKYIGSSNSYSDYLNYFQKEFHPTIWSYDCYPISEVNGQIKVNYNLFYSNLEYFRSISDMTHRPFWAYCQCMEYKNTRLYRPKCTVPYLRFEAFSALAYGAQGIIYWAYAQQASKYDSFLSAPINIEGEKTEEWHFVQKVNREISAFAQIFKGALIIDCRHTGNLFIKNTRTFSNNFWPLAACKSGREGVLLSLLKNSEGYYLIIVNHDIINNQTISLSFQEGIKGSELTLLDDGRLQQQNFSKQFDKDITPGGYTIIKIHG